MSQNLHSIQPQPRATVPAVTEAAPIYYGILTDQGQALLAAAIASGTPLPLTAMAAGDGGGQPVTPLAEMTELVNEVHRAPLNQLFVDPTAPNQIVAEMVMAETVGGFWIRELGLFAESGELFAVCNTPDSYKPVLAEGAGRSLLTRMILIVSDTAAVELIINPDTVMASRAYVDAKLAEHAASRDHPAATEGAQGMIPLATQAMVDAGTDHASAVTPQTAGVTFARQQHEHEISDVLFLEQELDGKQPLDAMLTALAALVTAADKLLYFTGADAPALATFTAFARTLLDDANAGAMLTTLGVSMYIQGLLNDADSTAARSTLAVPVRNSGNFDDMDCNTLVEGGMYRLGPTPLNVPTGNWQYSNLLVIRGTADTLAQMIFNYTTNAVCIRVGNPPQVGGVGMWQPWRELFHEGHTPTAAEVGAINKSGDSGIGALQFAEDDNPIIMNAADGMPNYILSKKAGANSWYIGRGSTGDDVTWNSYTFGTNITLRANDAVCNKMMQAAGFQSTVAQGTTGDSLVRLDYLNGQLPNRYTGIGASKDLNTYQTPGFYSQPGNADAISGSNYPADVAGVLLVFKHAGICQVYITYTADGSRRIFHRNLYGTTWSAWATVYDTNFKPTAADVGAAPTSHTHFETMAALTAAFGTTYTNTSGKTMFISITTLHGGDDDTVECWVNGNRVSYASIAMSGEDSDGTNFCQGFFVPNGGTWVIKQVNGTETSIQELWSWK